MPYKNQRRRSSSSLTSNNTESLNSAQEPSSRRSSTCLSTDSNKTGNSKIQRHGSNTSWRSKQRKKKSDKQNLVDMNNSSDSEHDINYDDLEKRRSSCGSSYDPEISNHCNGDVPVLCIGINNNSNNNNNNNQCSSYANNNPNIQRYNSYACQSTLSPDDSVNSIVSSLGRKNSMIHEIRVLSPRNSLSGVFYSSSVISIKNPSFSSSFKLDEIPATLAESFKHDALLGAPFQAISDANTGETHLMQNPNRKFCIYFKWTDWMTQRNEYSLFIFSPDNKIRKRCIKIADHKYFDYVVLLFISLNCITLAMERPKIPPWSAEREFLGLANYLFTFVFAVEMLIKVIAKGLLYGEDAYFQTGWNIMDGILVGVSLFDIFLSFFAQKSPRIFGILRVFRLLRSLRPLR
jgi:hypothetical protein